MRWNSLENNYIYINLSIVITHKVLYNKYLSLNPSDFLRTIAAYFPVAVETRPLRALEASFFSRPKWAPSYSAHCRDKDTGKWGRVPSLVVYSFCLSWLWLLAIVDERMLHEFLSRRPLVFFIVQAPADEVFSLG